MNHWQDYPVPAMRQESLFGDRVVACFVDRPASFHALFERSSLQRLGAVAVPVGVREQRPGLAYIARQCGATAVVSVAALADRIPEGEEAPALRAAGQHWSSAGVGLAVHG